RPLSQPTLFPYTTLFRSGFNFVQSAKASSVIRTLNHNNRAGYKVSSLLYKTRTAVALKKLRLFKGRSKLHCFTKVKYTKATQTNNTNRKIKVNHTKTNNY